MPFLYYIPGATYAGLNASLLHACGLGATFSDLLANPAPLMTRVQCRQVHANGPDGGSGVIIAHQAAAGSADSDQIIGMQADSQTWVACKDGDFWLGRRRGWSPTPNDLERPRGSGFTAGYDVPLGDGQIWTVPTVRKIGRVAALPQSMQMDLATGEFQLAILQRYAAAWEASGEIFDHVFSTRGLLWARAFKLCVDMLSLNYRVSEYEVSLLGLITTDNYQEIYEAVVDWNKVIELIPGMSGSPNADQKKTQPAEEAVNISPGSPGD